MHKNYVTIPRDLDAITRIAREDEPAEAGLTPVSRDEIWSTVRAYYRTGTHPFISFMLRRNGKVVLHRSIGHARGNEPHARGDAPMVGTPDTPVCLFSASKAITSLLVHKLVEDGKLGLDDRVADYIPEYARHGKEKTTVRYLLAHRAGIPTVPTKNLDHRLLYDWDAVVAMLCAAKPFEATGERQAYHAITGGFILGELVRRVSGRTLPDVLRAWLAEPLGCRHLTFGLEKTYWGTDAPNVFTGPRPPWVLDLLAKRVLGASFTKVIEVSNEEGFRTAAIPAGNIYATADEASRVFQMLLNGGVYEGRRVFQPDTVEEMLRPVGKRQFDAMLVLPLRFSAGMMLGDNPVGLFGPGTRHAYGHIGFLNIVSWADPDRDLSCAILCNGKSIAPSSFTRLARIIAAVGRLCPPVPRR
ncbi:MAG TPA: serine hydrolase domain-containing protein [Nevskiaceae bacterium]|nr:serine hydrolase domain-containing protein [Nevskiaceae bacterium]